MLPASEATLGEFLAYISPLHATQDTPPLWPPDAFGLAGAMLLASGSYLTPFSEWPPSADGDESPWKPEEWGTKIRSVGSAWRRSWPEGPAPAEVSRWWSTVRTHAALPLSKVRETKRLCCALLQLCAAADEASHGAGMPRKKPREDRFGIDAEVRLVPRRRNKTGSTLCRDIHSSRLRVLPKFHTPQTGMTFRSLSHHLALWMNADVTPLWFTASRSEEPEGKGEEEGHSLSLLLIPWPAKVTPKQFIASRPSCGHISNMHQGKFGFFSFRHEDASDLLHHVKEIYWAARKLTDHVDGVVFPELALDRTEFDEIRNWITAQGSFLIAGVGKPSDGQAPGQNYVGIEVPMEVSPKADERLEGHRISAFQAKHHRWRLDRSQIVQYGLGGQLDPSRLWWEHIEASSRDLVFVSLREWLSLCALVCEDLARQDPVANLVRVVGPNLVIALLMDGPQLASRWPARYATVLADDPGSSVLSFTSLGMCKFSRPVGKPLSRVVALWKDAHSSEAVQIEMPADADAVLLNLVRQMEEEWTADGRFNQGAGYPALAGVHPISRPPEGTRA